MLLALVGRNGAGKTTFYELALRQLPLPFLNADRVARSLRPAQPEAASYAAMRATEAMRADLVARKQPFIMETVLSDPLGAKLDFFRKAIAEGYLLIIVHIRIESADLSRGRVAQRVREGGHAVPTEKLESRFPRTQLNVAEALKLAHVGLVYDNSSFIQPYRLVETWLRGRRVWVDR